MAPSATTTANAGPYVKRNGKIITRVNIDFLIPKLQQLQEKNANLSILDVGAGHGPATMLLAQAVPGCTMTAVDINPAHFERARALCQLGGYQGEIKFHEADARSLPFPDASFDVVFCHQMLVHIPRPWEAIREMARVTRPGGIVAAREGDLETQALWPKPAWSDKMHQLVASAMSARGGDPEGGRKLLEWTVKAGFQRDQITRTYSPWLCQTTEEREAWSDQVTSMLRDSDHWIARMGLQKEFTTPEDLEEIAKGWEEWAHNEEAHQVMLNAEVVMEK